MKLQLTLTSCPAAQGRDTQRYLTAGQLRIGRAPDNDWAMRDPDRVLSKYHCVIEFKGGVYLVIDTSTNGVFHNENDQPIGRGNSAILKDGDRLRFGDCVLRAKFVNDELPEQGADPFLAVLRQPDSPAVPSLRSDDPFALPPAGPRAAVPIIPLDDDELSDLLPPRPRPSDPFSAETAWQRSAPDWGSATPTQADDAGPAVQAWRPPPPAVVTGAGRANANAGLIPDDWDDAGPFAAPPVPDTVAAAAPVDITALERQARDAAMMMGAVLPGHGAAAVRGHMEALLVAARGIAMEAGVSPRRLEDLYRRALLSVPEDGEDWK